MFVKVFSSSNYFLVSIVACLFILGVANYFLITSPNQCSMTYMFQFPQFIPISLDQDIKMKYPNYNLYAYGEGPYAETLRLGVFSGIPVLFVPGHGGSYKQVRSLGSVALRMTQTTKHFDYFAIDFNGELSGIDGELLFKQTEFLKETTKTILKIYDDAYLNTSLILIGHSIGGILCRGLVAFLDSNLVKNIQLILTLASPHQSPVISLDFQMIQFYKIINSFWLNQRNESLAHLNVISIGGSSDDKLVRSDLTQLPTNFQNDLSIRIFSIQDVWLSTDHVGIVWCKQLIVKINRLLFDLVDEKSPRYLKNKRQDIIEYHLAKRFMGKHYPQHYIQEYKTFQPIGDWQERRERQIRITKNKVLAPINVLIPLFRRETIVINYSGDFKYDWIFACNETQSDNLTHCDVGMNLYKHSKLLPSHSKNIEERFYKVPGSYLINSGFSHLLLTISATSKPINLIVDRFTSSVRQKVIVLPSLINSLIPFWSPAILDIHVSDPSTFYDLSLIGLEQVWHAYWLQFEIISCYPNAKDVVYLHLTFPWYEGDFYKFVRPKKGQIVKFALKVNTPRPTDLPQDEVPHLFLILDSECGYRLRIKPSLIEISDQIVRHFGTWLLPMIGAILISILSEQIYQTHHYTKDLNVLSTNNHKSDDLRYFYLSNTKVIFHLKSITVYGLLVYFPVIFTSFLKNFKSNFLEVASLKLNELFILETVIFVISFSVLVFLNQFIYFLFKVLSSIINYVFVIIKHKMCSKYKKNNQDFNSSLKYKIIPFVMASLLAFVAIVYNTCLSMIFGLILQHIQLLQLFIECAKTEHRIGSNLTSTLRHLHLTIILIMYISMVPAIPVLLSWFYSGFPLFKYGIFGSHFLAALTQSMSCCVIWLRFYKICPNRLTTNILVILLKVLAFSLIILGQHNYSLIPIQLSISLVIVCIFHSIGHKSKSFKVD